MIRRDKEKMWGDYMNSKSHVYEKPSDEEIKKKLTPLQFNVTQACGTEPPFNNAYYVSAFQTICCNPMTLILPLPVFSA